VVRIELDLPDDELRERYTAASVFVSTSRRLLCRSSRR
jgi:hypothetical protein